MESLGVRVKNTKRFYVVNPTNVSYEFTWTPDTDANPSFRCATPKGLMLAGKRCEMIFEFTPQQLDLQEMFWRFRVPHFQVDQLFLFVGTTTEPRVTLDRGSINFNTLLIGTKASQSVALVNHEHIPFNFVFDKTSIDFAGETPALVVHPLSGIVPPNGRSLIDLEFIPVEEKNYSFNLSCIVKRKPSRLSLNVKGEGYNIHDALSIVGDDNESHPVELGSGNHLDFGAVRVHETAVRTVVIQNTGKFNFEFNWSHATSSKMNTNSPNPPMIPALTIDPIQGTVKKNDKVMCSLVFAPTKPMSLDTFGSLTCLVAGARQYHFSMHGLAVPPSLQFSFTSHDFGPCFIADADAIPQSERVMLTIFNMDPNSSVDIDCLFENKPHLRVDCPPSVLGARETITIPLVFTARNEVSYLELVPFLVNNSTTVSISIRGEGVFPKVELANTAMQTVAFGALQIGQQLTRSVKIVNRAKRKAVVVFGTDEDQRDSAETPSLGSLGVYGITVFPTKEIVLKAKESLDIEIRFAPTQRIVAFEKNLFICVAGSRKKLLTVSGCCLGMDVQLEMDTISFGTVCMGSQLVRKIHLQNRGDVVAKFQWNPRSFAPDFSINPLDGAIAANSHKALEVTFKPTVIHPDLRYERLCCVIDGADPVFLTLVGSCVKQSASSIQDIHFESRVREPSTKSVTIENKTALPWNLLPVVQGEHWSCPENVAVPAEGKATLEIGYRPLTMTRQPGDEPGNSSRPEQHQGSIFLAIPDGTAISYNVFGKASAPSLAGTLTETTAAKKSLSISIPVSNWLKQTQVFHVDIQKPSDERSSVIAQGAQSFTVQPLASRNYHLKFFSYTEGEVALSVRFVNAENGEYVQYDVRVVVTKASEVDVIKLEAPVRQSVKKLITIENPFAADRKVHFADKENWWKCSHPCVRVRQLRDINDGHEGVYEVEYRPTVFSDGVVEAILTLAFVELGDFTYRMVLATQAAGVERVIHFKAALGSSQVQTVAFTTFCDKSVDVTCSVEHPAYYTVPPLVKVEPTTNWEGKVHSLQVKFEPETLGDIRDTLVVRSDVAGEYKYSLQGEAVVPPPQGPFIVTGSKDIEFKNVFSTARDFDIVVDNPRFTVSAKTMNIPPKSSKAVTVKVDPNGSGTTAGKLLISCPSMKEVPQWVYYLEASTT